MQKFFPDLSISFVQPGVRQRYEREPDLLAGEIEALRKEKGGGLLLICLDEIQKVPVLMILGFVVFVPEKEVIPQKIDWENYLNNGLAWNWFGTRVYQRHLAKFDFGVTLMVLKSIG